MKIPIAKTEFTDADFENIRKPLESGWVVQGPFVKEFEDKWCKFTGAANSVAVTSCTTGLHLSLAALGVKEGNEVIVPAFTWIATANSVEYTGAKPVFCDIELSTFNLDVKKFEKLITKKTKAVIPVHLFGLPSDMDAIKYIAEKNSLFVIEDAACGFAAKYRNIHVGNFGDTGCFSFHPRKAITTGEGGMITTNNGELYEKLRSLRDHGAAMSDLQRHLQNKPYLLPEFPYLGYNYRMTDIQASIGSSQMERAVEIYESRKKIADKYSRELSDIDWLVKPFVGKDYVHGYQSYVCLFKPEEINSGNLDKVNLMRNEFMDYLFEKGISTRPGTHAVHNLAYYNEKYCIKSESYMNSLIADKCSIAFPVFPSLKEEESDYIIEYIKNFKIK
ncbi:MAG: DegT/DnrJ/EryC1/StrS family aminotransferase [Ignavibacteriae bacterium]|nr:DegT/DnrJ/EryC1/StrS family aminotransferase [Ignavibacteriota bacterium]